MYDYKQRKTTKEYRDNWELIYRRKDSEQGPKSGEYRNGCPILDDSTDTRHQ